MKKLAIIGSGHLGQQIAHYAIVDNHYDVVGYFDDFVSKYQKVNSLEVIGTSRDILESYESGTFDCLLIGIGYKHFGRRQELFELFNGKVAWGQIIHSSSIVDRTCVIGEASVIYPGCVLDMNVKVGDNVIINLNCVLAHDSSVGNNCFLSPSVSVAGFSKVGSSVKLGIGTTIIDNIVISDNISTGAGAVVVDNLMQQGLYLGVPAKYYHSK